MRKATRRKYYGRINVIQLLKVATGALAEAISEAEKPVAASPLLLKLQAVQQSIVKAIDEEKYYLLGRKRFQKHLTKELRNIEELIAEVKGIPVFTEEKALAKKKRAVKKNGAGTA